MIVSVMVAMVVVYWSRLYGDEQHGRRDMKPVEYEHDEHNNVSEDGEEGSEMVSKSLLFNDFEIT
jgi:hypothetical protein